MRIWNSPSRLLTLSLILALAPLLLPLSVPAQQVRIPSAALDSAQGLEQVLQAGQQLEAERRWGEALTHYEEALKQYPGRHDLQQRLVQTRIRLDLARRYSDSSFLAVLRELDERRALELYSEVLSKIHTHYVHSPQWHELIRRGNQHLEAALGDPEFVQKNLPHVSQERIEAFRRDLARRLDGSPVHSRQQARQAVERAAHLAAQQLGLRRQATILEYTCGATGALDSYSSYLTGGQLDEMFAQIDGNFVGLGIELKADNRSLLIVSVIAGGPAAQAGIRGGDRIVQVDGQSTEEVSTDTAAEMLKGPEGSTVELTVRTQQGVRRTLRVSRQRVEVPSLEEIRMLDGQQGIAYVRLTSFQKTTARELDAALWKLHRQGMRSLILDVRGNPGGLLTASVEAADKFVSGGTIVSTRGRSAHEDYDYKAHTAGTWRVPLVVLIDGDSASASEIFAGAVRDHRRGTVVGQRSYGKGSVQGIFPLNTSKAGLRLTTANFYSPNGHAISKNGVQPDVAVHTTARPLHDESEELADQEDAVLKAGVQIAKQQLSQR